MPSPAGIASGHPRQGMMTAAGAFSVGFGSFQQLGTSRKTPMLSESTSIVARLAPSAALTATLAAAALVPSFTLGMALSPLADMLVIVALLTIARVAITLASLDSGAPLPGFAQQGASARAVLAEPAPAEQESFRRVLQKARLLAEPRFQRLGTILVDCAGDIEQGAVRE